jgi:exodeoxyribonuclease V alpha subunit
MIGPNVDAAGLYVGLTCGRVCNQAVAIAGSQFAGRQAIAQSPQSMLRGTVETTIDQSRRAARADLRHAARERGLDTTAPFTLPVPSTSRGLV